MAKGKMICEQTRDAIKTVLEKEFPELEMNVFSTIQSYSCSKKGQRAPSEYNLFVSKCMKDEGKAMKQCAVEWKEMKGK